MNLDLIMLIINCITVGALLFSIIYTAGVVWRVEKELDISYKFFLAAIIFLTAAEVAGLFSPQNATAIALGVKLLRMLFTLCFLAGVFCMRDIVRKLDGEKNN